MDPKDRDSSNNGEATAQAVSTPAVHHPELDNLDELDELNAAPSAPSLNVTKSDELMRRGEALFENGLFSHAIHVWTRILFLQRGHRDARHAIERGKKAVAEQQRLLDLELAAASDLLDNKETARAAAKVRSVLAIDPRHREAHHLAARISAATNRTEPATTTAAPEPVSREPAPRATGGLLLRVERTHRGREPRSVNASPLKLAGFVLAAVLVFASGALFLHLNWDSIVSDGAFSSAAGPVPKVSNDDSVSDAPLPGISELHYFNGARLFAKERYREALHELGRVDRDSIVAERARSLILRIEERLLRSVSEPSAVGLSEAR